MHISRAFALSFGSLSVLAACGGSPTPPPVTTAATPATNASSIDAKLRAVVAGLQRTAPEKARDVYRHPVETLEFFGLKEDMTVVELAPGTGWYTAILAPALAEHGKLVVAGGDPNGPPDSEGTKNARNLADRFAKDPASFGKVQTLVVDWKKDGVSLGPDGSADMVLTFRNMHNWIGHNMGEKVLAAAHKVLKPGGLFALTDHRGKPDAPTDSKTVDDTGYMPEAFLIAFVEKNGFKLADKSEINANPKDTKDYPKGVWTLPPTYEMKDVDHARYEAIGESDRMTLRFVRQ